MHSKDNELPLRQQFAAEKFCGNSDDSCNMNLKRSEWQDVTEQHLSTADISTPAELLLPNLNVISSGCFFLDVIFTTEFSACLDWM